ncbi:AGE family epimerase/isomerase [Thalassotalea sp. 1_MG-2023]|uniref:AGE family epimerase/isomerase n=1 Tax=Thalassotalea sp. 1_MG-2023 TaxID=3062680 RepID=UPI0026E1AF9B|nr:AGE family epimerase/isomerase [Thalassotalea sp. 1_MG-2023]MDO6426015.1 AGE family epimerase/isomerase [Thalassotalea sp. 1_MG-2023]
MNFFSRTFLADHCVSIYSFYEPNIIDCEGGYFQNFNDDGSLFDKDVRHLVSSTRIIVNYALAVKYLGQTQHIDKIKHGLDYLEKVHWREAEQGYAWTIANNAPSDMTQQAYGYAFVLLAYAASFKAGVVKNTVKIEHIFDLLEQRFWQVDYGLYADTLSTEGELSPYRGQNANMHICEAMIAAYQATGVNKFLERAQTIAKNICVVLANKTNGLVWEHYDANFEADWLYNKDDPKNIYRPWGYQPGHQTEWTKLLLLINEISPEPWLVEKATELFDRSYQLAWDNEHGGLVYGFDHDGNWCDTDKYFWVQAESIASAAMLFKATNDEKYLTHYHQLWHYCWENFIDHKYGAWYRLLKQDNSKYSNKKSSAGAKCDYHTLGACIEVYNLLQK